MTTARASSRGARIAQAPAEVDRVDGPHPGVPEPHVHLKHQRAALCWDGTGSHGGIPQLSNAVKKWLLDNGWKVPD